MAACNADRLLDDSFRTQTEMLLSALPQRRQTLAFSATFTPVRTYLLTRAPCAAPLHRTLHALNRHAAAVPDRSCTTAAYAAVHTSEYCVCAHFILQDLRSYLEQRMRHPQHM
jgi:hypothetical protein